MMRSTASGIASATPSKPTATSVSCACSSSSAPAPTSCRSASCAGRGSRASMPTASCSRASARPRPRSRKPYAPASGSSISSRPVSSRRSLRWRTTSRRQPASEFGSTLTWRSTAIRASGINTLEALDVGGGLGVRYHNEKAPAPKAFAEAVVPVVAAAGLGLLCEPGRYLVANAGVLLTRVLYRKHSGGKEYVIVDAGMSDFVRPSHYNAHHEIMPLRDGQRPEEMVNVVGPICETGDFLALDRKMVAVGPGEVLAVLGTGAYGFVMSSTYNQRPRAPEVVVDGDRYYVARQRETLEDLVRGETAEPTTWYKA